LQAWPPSHAAIRLSSSGLCLQDSRATRSSSRIPKTGLGPLAHLMRLVRDPDIDLSGWRDLNSRPLDHQIGGRRYAALPERASPMKAARKRLGVLPRSVRWAPSWAQTMRSSLGLGPDAGRCGRDLRCARGATRLVRRRVRRFRRVPPRRARCWCGLDHAGPNHRPAPR
jgi:hypothetical protein